MKPPRHAAGRVSAIALVAVLALQAGCSGRSAAPSPTSPTAAASAPRSSATPTPFTPTYADLVRALPRTSELSDWDVVQRCVSPRAACSRSDSRRDRGHGTYATYSGSRRGSLREQLQVSVISWPSAEDTERWLEHQRSQSQNDYTGLFRRDPDDRGDGTYQPGETGRGSLTAITRDRWRGYLVAATLRYQLVGETSPPSVHTGVVVVRDRYAVLVQVDRWAARSGAARSGPTARRVLDGVLSRLDAPAPG